ncbi:MAG: tRNA (5-methylaminomethyl-2-thiouridine)(34)-methyltransferase MnmD [Flavisolibacter sp.]|nr:tRNA (5-methylaminomethyl-2-thiouridine)(34)-methyltransferase MnmD [Flavisolibacter sp.]
MQREIIITSDGSHTVAVPELNVTYHSRYGAVQESLHVFIRAGLYYVWEQFPDTPIHIIEMGFGTGLNALLTAIEAQKRQRSIHYTAIEKFPLTIEEALNLNYTQQLQHQELFEQMHQCRWHEDVVMAPYFILRKEEKDLLAYTASSSVHLIYYDAFAPAAQPELWTQEVFVQLHRMLVPGGVLVTYCAKGAVRRAMQAAGFLMEKLSGPPGKREMLRGSREGPYIYKPPSTLNTCPVT